MEFLTITIIIGVFVICVRKYYQTLKMKTTSPIDEISELAADDKTVVSSLTDPSSEAPSQTPSTKRKRKSSTKRTPPMKIVK